MPHIYMFMNTPRVYLLVPFFRLYHAIFMKKQNWVILRRPKILDVLGVLGHTSTDGN